MTQAALVAHHGVTMAVNFDYDRFREAVAHWKGGRGYKKAADAADIERMSLYRFLKGQRLIAWDTIQKLCQAMHRETEEFMR